MAALREGIAEASSGAGLLALGSEHATEGAALIASGLARAAGGSGRAIDALERFAKGSEKLTEGLLRGGNRRASSCASPGSTSVTNPPLQRPADCSASRSAGCAPRQNETLPRLLAPTEGERRKAAGGGSETEGSGARPTRRPRRRSNRCRAALAAITGTDPATGAALRRRLRGPRHGTRRAASERLGEDGELKPRKVDHLHPLDDRRNAHGRARRGPPDRRPLQNPQGRQHARPRRRQTGQGSGPARQRDRKAERRRDPAGHRPRPAERRRRSAGRKPRRRAWPRSSRWKPGSTEASVKVLEGHAQIRKQAGEVQEQTPGLFNSGYFVLSALDGAPPGHARKSGADDRPEQRRPGGLDAGDLEVRIQLAGVDRTEQEARRARRTNWARTRASRPASRAAPRS